ncbi:hypothetical protein SK128_019913 [Halocaridina rubra]|uniref:Uncharacterized protein n=1 Tax=Halocaridina rubra TaxID=373956 RepID=A0AAN9ABN0_HALRR
MTADGRNRAVHRPCKRSVIQETLVHNLVPCSDLLVYVKLRSVLCVPDPHSFKVPMDPIDHSSNVSSS